MKSEIESAVSEWMDSWLGWILGAVSFFAIAVVVAVVIGVLLSSSRPLPTCPNGYVLAGGGYAGRYHCIPGAEPIR